MKDVIQKRILLTEYQYEWLIHVQPEINFYAVKEDMDEYLPMPVLVYRVEKQVSEHEWVYTFQGVRIQQPKTRVQRNIIGHGVRVWIANLIIKFGWWIAGK